MNSANVPIYQVCPFMIVASYEECSVGTIYHFLCQDLCWVNGVGGLDVEARGGVHVHV